MAFSYISVQHAFVGFTAQLGGEPVSYDLHDPVIFGYALTNFGDAYDTNTGAFTCPIDGVYSFTVSISLSTPWGIDLDIFHSNGTFSSFVFDLYSPSSSTLESSNSAVVHCYYGQRVKVIANEAFTFNESFASSFTGHLLYPIIEPMVE